MEILLYRRGTLSGVGNIEGDIQNAGTVAVLDAFNTMSSSSVSSNGNINALTLNGSVTNNGTLQIGGSAPGNTMTITGDYIGNGGTVNINTVLDNDDSSTDKLIIQGILPVILALKLLIWVATALPQLMVLRLSMSRG